MALINSYPSYLPPMQMNKRQSAPDGFVQSPVNAGPPFVEQITSDTPTSWNGQVIMTTGQAGPFEVWIRQIADGDTEPAPIDFGWFNMPVKTALGLFDQEVRFLTRPQISTADNIARYNFELITRAVNHGYDISNGSDDSQCILDIADISPDGDIDAGGRLLAQAVNEEWPD